MSEKRIGIIAEGKTDFPIIKGAIKALFPELRFVFTHIQPSESDLLGKTINVDGFGWRGVYHACVNLKERLDLQSAAGTTFDCLIIHVDADLMTQSYGRARVSPRNNDVFLPCYDASQSIEYNCDLVENVVISWLDGQVSDNTALCIPCMNTDTWAAYILSPSLREHLTESLSVEELNHHLLSVPVRERLVRRREGQIRKKTIQYDKAGEMIDSSLWDLLCVKYRQAQKFTDKVRTLHTLMN